MAQRLNSKVGQTTFLPLETTRKKLFHLLKTITLVLKVRIRRPLSPTMEVNRLTTSLHVTRTRLSNFRKVSFLLALPSTVVRNRRVMVQSKEVDLSILELPLRLPILSDENMLNLRCLNLRIPSNKLPLSLDRLLPLHLEPLLRLKRIQT